MKNGKNGCTASAMRLAAAFMQCGGIAAFTLLAPTHPVLGAIALLLLCWGALEIVFSGFCRPDWWDFLPSIIPEVPPPPWPDVPPEDAREAPVDLLHPTAPSESP